MPAQGDDRFYSLSKICLGTLLALSLVAAALLSASPALHEQLHPHTAATSHLCVVTLLASGQCQSATGSPVFAAPAALPTCAALPLPSFSLLSATRVTSILEHAPPFSA
jgi:hypothetical protein